MAEIATTMATLMERVVMGLESLRLKIPASTKPTEGQENNDQFVPDDDVALEQLEREFEHTLDVWRPSSSRKEFLDLIDTQRPSDGWRFDKVVCLGTGSFSTDLCIISGHLRIGPGACEGSMFQFACLADTVCELEKRGHGADGGIRVFAQDRLYTPTDCEFMMSKGVTVLDTYRRQPDMGNAKEHVGPQTLLFEFRVSKSPLMHKNIYETEFGMLVGREVEFLRELAEWSEEAQGGPRVSSPTREYDYELPQFYTRMADRFERKHEACDFHRIVRVHYTGFGALKIYWRREPFRT